MVGRLLAVVPDADLAQGYLAYAKLNLCDWNGLPEVIAALRDQVTQAKAVTLPFHGLLTLTSPHEQLLCAKARVALEFPRGSVAKIAPRRCEHDRIRIAYVSADFHEHATSYLMAGLIEHHDRSRFETVGVSFGPDDGSATQHRIRGAFERFLDVRGCSDLEAARAHPRTRGRHRGRPEGFHQRLPHRDFRLPRRRRSRSTISAIPAPWAPTSSTTSSPTRCVIQDAEQQPFYAEKIV